MSAELSEHEDSDQQNHVATEAYDLVRSLNWKMVRELRSFTKASSNGRF